jgi:hypothetical protein
VQVLTRLHRNDRDSEKIHAAGWKFLSELFSSWAQLSFIGVGVREKKPAAAKTTFLQR